MVPPQIYVHLCDAHLLSRTLMFQASTERAHVSFTRQSCGHRTAPGNQVRVYLGITHPKALAPLMELSLPVNSSCSVHKVVYHGATSKDAAQVIIQNTQVWQLHGDVNTHGIIVEITGEVPKSTENEKNEGTGYERSMATVRITRPPWITGRRPRWASPAGGIPCP